MENFRQLMEIIGTAVDAVGVVIVAAGALVATARLLVRRAHNTGNYYSSFDCAHPHVSEFVAPTGNRRKIAVAPRRTTPGLI